MSICCHFIHFLQSCNSTRMSASLTHLKFTGVGDGNLLRCCTRVGPHCLDTLDNILSLKNIIFRRVFDVTISSVVLLITYTYRYVKKTHLENLPKDNVTSIEPCGLDGGDEELRPVGVGTGIRHGKVERRLVLENEVFVGKLFSIDARVRCNEINCVISVVVCMGTNFHQLDN